LYKKEDNTDMFDKFDFSANEDIKELMVKDLKLENN